MPLSQKIEYLMQRISVNLTNDCDGNQLDYNNNLPVIRNKNYALQKPFETDFLTVIGNAKLRPSLVVCLVAQAENTVYSLAQCSPPRCGPRHSILLSNICFYVK